MDFIRRSKLTGEYHHRSIEVDTEAYKVWLYSDPEDPKWFADKAFPNLSEDEIDFIVSGVTPEEREAVLREEGLDGAS